MAFLAAIACVGILSFLLVEYSERLPRQQKSKLRRWYLIWTIKAIAVPMLLWVLFNGGVFSGLPTLARAIELASTRLGRAQVFVTMMGYGAYVIATYWAALTSGWLLLEFYRQSDMQLDFKKAVATWSLVLGPLALLVAWSWGWNGLGLALTIWLMPLLQVACMLKPESAHKPSYSRAVARIQFDKFEEAEMAVIDELEKSEEDFDGWMMLAELYAVHFHDLGEAERTVMETCQYPSVTDSQRSIALHKLADWRLKLADDPVGARRALEEICRVTSNSHLARMSRLRIKQIPETREEWLEQQKGKTYHLPALRKDFDETLGGENTAVAPPGEETVLRARRLSEKLGKDPNDVAVREELARLLAEKLGKVDAGLQQLELLLTVGGQPVAKVAEWMGLMAAWQMRYKHDVAAGRIILERIARQFPQSSQGFAAQRRLNLMNIEEKVKANRAARPVEPKISLLPG